MKRSVNSAIRSSRSVGPLALAKNEDELSVSDLVGEDRKSFMSYIEERWKHVDTKQKEVIDNHVFRATDQIG